MAKKDKAKKKSKDKPKGKGKPKANGLGLKGRLFLISFVLLGVIFLPTSLLLLIGMFPSMIAFIYSMRGRGFRASTVVAMNLAGCIPFIFKLWSLGHTFEMSVEVLTGQNTIFIMYMAAAFGFMIDWVVTGLVSSYMYQKGVSRMKSIKKRQQVIIDSWGRGVASGLLPDNED